MHRRLRRALALGAVVAVVAGGCGDDDEDAAAGVDDVGVTVSDAWARSSPDGVSAGAAYLTIVSAADDQLVGASVPADVAATVELHETVAGDEMSMRQVSAVDLPAGEPVVVEPGGLHVMLVDLAGPLESGSSFELTLAFADAAPLTVTVDVRDEAP